MEQPEPGEASVTDGAGQGAHDRVSPLYLWGTQPGSSWLQTNWSSQPVSHSPGGAGWCGCWYVFLLNLSSQRIDYKIPLNTGENPT